MIFFTTRAYNAEATLGRTIESVLAQSVGDFIYYVCNNASEDGTEDVLQEYARMDPRVVPIPQTPNDWLDYDRDHRWTPELERYHTRLMFYLEPEDWFAVLDADDEYKPDFLAETVGFAKQENLDFVACRSDFIHEPDGEIHNKFVLENDIVISDSGFGTLFPQYFRFMGTQWGKLNKGSLFKEIDRSDFERFMRQLGFVFRGDAAMEMYFLQYSKRAGVRAKALHNYHLYPKSLTRNTENSQIHARENQKMPEVYREFLRQKVGSVSDENERCIMEQYERMRRRFLEEGGEE